MSIVKCRDRQRPKLIVTESYSGTRNVQEIFSNILLSHLAENASKLFTLDNPDAIIKETDNSQNQYCSERFTA